MNVVNVVQRNTYVVVEFTPDEISKLIDFLDHTQVTFDGEKEPNTKIAAEYVVGRMYPMLKDLIEEIKRSGLK